jgi:two-component system CheB/CheR fusion protein
MILVDEQGKILFANPQAEKTFGFTKEELLGQPVEMLVPGRYRGRHTQDRSAFNAHADARAMGAGRDLFGLRKDGSQIPVEIGLTPLKSEAGLQILASIIDITERKRMEAAQKRLENEVLEATELERRRIGQELHDGLGQQLLGIAFLSGALKERLHQKSLSEAADAGQIADLLEKVIAEARKLSRELYAAELEAHGLCEALKHLVEDVGATTNIDCQFVCEKPFVIEDKSQATNLYRIVQEALQNARRHSLATEIVVTAKITPTDFQLTIKDNGVGFPPDDKSTGMGLKTMKYRVDILGGTFQACNDKDGGAVVSCTVPLKKSSAL